MSGGTQEICLMKGKSSHSGTRGSGVSMSQLHKGNHGNLLHIADRMKVPEAPSPEVAEAEPGRRHSP
ncbi:Monocarboxylate Transporter 4 [Manis pentadactyla]|nr:Monocarboxylate Transporter 4 [Manis pentadactyla]